MTDRERVARAIESSPIAWIRRNKDKKDGEQYEVCLHADKIVVRPVVLSSHATSYAAEKEAARYSRLAIADAALSAMSPDWRALDTAPEKTLLIWLFQGRPEIGLWEKSVERMDGRSGPIWWGGVWVSDIPHGAEQTKFPERFPVAWAPIPPIINEV